MEIWYPNIISKPNNTSKLLAVTNFGYCFNLNLISWLKLCRSTVYNFFNTHCFWGYWHHIDIISLKNLHSKGSKIFKLFILNKNQLNHIGSEPHCRIIEGSIGLSAALVWLCSIAVTNSKPSSTCVIFKCEINFIFWTRIPFWLQYLSEHDMSAIQPCGDYCRYEELTTVCIYF